MAEWLHPGMVLIGAAAVVPFTRGLARKVFVVAAGGAALAAALATTPGIHGAFRFLEWTLVFGRADRLSLVFGYVFTLMALIGVVYSLHVEEAGSHAAALVYAGSALGAVFAGDLLVLFLFWELMAFSSVFLVWFGGRRDSLAAGYRYLLMHVLGGASLLAGIVLHYGATGSLAFNGLVGSGPGATLILAGFILNAAMPPLSAWLTDAYPEASITGAVFLSAFTTKTAVYVLVRGFSGYAPLAWLGAVMALYGVIYAVLQNDARRLLAYHIVSQVGYMVAGVGLGSELAVNGSVAHAFAHIIYKGLLFMGAGAVLFVTGKSKLSDMGGLGRRMPWTFALYMVGAFSISALPLTSGFVSKSMVVAGAGAAHQTAVFLLLTAASAGTFLSVGLKLPYFMFLGKDSGLPAREPPRNMLVAMGIAAFVCVFIGVVPGSLYAVLPFPAEFSPYTGQHLVSTMEILLLTAAAFVFLVAKLAPKPSIALDTDWFYRKAAAGLMWLVRKPISGFEFGVIEGLHLRLLKPLPGMARATKAFDTRIIDGAVEGVARGASKGGELLRDFQNGSFQRYAWVMVGGVVLALAWLLFFVV